MQPKARMTFRFDPPSKSSPRPAEQPGQEHEIRQLQDPQSLDELHPELQRRNMLDDHLNMKPFDLQQQDPKRRDPHQRRDPQQDSRYFETYTGGPLLDDPYTLEEIIRRAEPAVERPKSAAQSAPFTKSNGKPDAKDFAPAPDPDSETAGWDIPENNAPLVSEWFSGKYPQAAGPSWWRAFATVAGAIATGALFGYLVLTLFTGTPVLPDNLDKPDSGTAAPAQAAGSSSEPDKPPSAEAPGGSDQAGANTGAMLPEWTYYMLQYGVFTTEEGMNAALEELKNRGLPGVADRSDGYRVYAGGAPTRDEAERLAGQMPGLAVFVKPLTSESVAAGAGKELGTFVRLSHELAARLSELSVAALQDEKPQPIGEEELSAVRETHRQWLAASAAADGLAEPAGRAAQEMIRALNAAMVSIDDYSRKVSRFHLWRVQEDVLDTVLADRALRSAVVSEPRN